MGVEVTMDLPGSDDSVPTEVGGNREGARSGALSTTSGADLTTSTFTAEDEDEDEAAGETRSELINECSARCGALPLDIMSYIAKFQVLEDVDNIYIAIPRTDKMRDTFLLGYLRQKDGDNGRPGTHALSLIVGKFWDARALDSAEAKTKEKLDASRKFSCWKSINEKWKETYCSLLDNMSADARNQPLLVRHNGHRHWVCNDSVLFHNPAAAVVIDDSDVMEHALAIGNLDLNGFYGLKEHSLQATPDPFHLLHHALSSKASKCTKWMLEQKELNVCSPVGPNNMSLMHLAMVLFIDDRSTRPRVDRDTFSSIFRHRSADVEVMRNGNSPLFLATKLLFASNCDLQRQLEAIALLVREGASLNSPLGISAHEYADAAMKTALREGNLELLIRSDLVGIVLYGTLSPEDCRSWPRPALRCIAVFHICTCIALFAAAALCILNFVVDVTIRHLWPFFLRFVVIQAAWLDLLHVFE